MAAKKTAKKAPAKKAPAKKAPAKGAEPTVKQRGNSGLANLKPFEPGRSGNPKGRPKGLTLTELVRKKLEELAPDGHPHMAALAAAVIATAMGGSGAVIRELWERLEGKVPDLSEQKSDGTLRVVVEYADRKPDAAQAPPGPAEDHRGKKTF